MGWFFVSIISYLPGTYGNATGLSACVRCPSGTYSLMTAQTSGNTCLNCSSGSYGPTKGANNTLACLVCAPGIQKTNNIYSTIFMLLYVLSLLSLYRNLWGCLWFISVYFMLGGFIFGFFGSNRLQSVCPRDLLDYDGSNQCNSLSAVSGGYVGFRRDTF